MLGLMPEAAILKVLIISEREADVFIFRWALQIAQLVLIESVPCVRF